jgi:serine kinase of HPr protein (carbohydrate metabolism regulator)
VKPPTLSSEILHASTVALDGRAVLITGPSGSGKSDLALRLLDRGFKLVSDDQTIIRLDGERLVASPPANIAGKLEVRGIGIVEVEHDENVPVALMVALTSEILRMPEDRTDLILGVPVPLVAIDPSPPSAASKVALALDCMGLK